MSMHSVSGRVKPRGHRDILEPEALPQLICPCCVKRLLKGRPRLFAYVAGRIGRASVHSVTAHLVWPAWTSRGYCRLARLRSCYCRHVAAVALPQRFPGPSLPDARVAIGSACGVGCGWQGGVQRCRRTRCSVQYQGRKRGRERPMNCGNSGIVGPRPHLVHHGTAAHGGRLAQLQGGLGARAPRPG